MFTPGFTSHIGMKRISSDGRKVGGDGLPSSLTWPISVLCFCARKYINKNPIEDLLYFAEKKNGKGGKGVRGGAQSSLRRRHQLFNAFSDLPLTA